MFVKRAAARLTRRVNYEIKLERARHQEMAYAIIRVTKLKGAAVSASDAHADRTSKTIDNIDRSKTNVYLLGNKGKPLRSAVRAVIAGAGGKPRKDSVECIEFLMTASPNYFSSSDALSAFIEKSQEFMAHLEVQGIRFVKAVVHLDTTTPCITAFAVPLDKNGKLNAKYHIGERYKLAKLQDDFAEIMKQIGLKRGVAKSVATHQDLKNFYSTIIKEPEIHLTGENIPDPPFPLVSELEVSRYKEKVVEAVRAEIMPQINEMKQQARLTLHYKSLLDDALDGKLPPVSSALPAPAAL